jgi:hypothetical protein
LQAVLVGAPEKRCRQAGGQPAPCVAWLVGRGILLAL